MNASPMTRSKTAIAGPLVALVVSAGATACGTERDDLDAVATTTTDAPPATTEAPATTTTEAAPTTAAPTTAAPTTAAPTTTTAPPAPTTPPETVSQSNARRKAADYLDYAAFSHSGLIEQLKYEGFSQDDAAYGVDALNVNWNEQAAKKAAEYLDYSAFSRSGLIEQLLYEGFSEAEAEYGVGTTGL